MTEIEKKLLQAKHRLEEAEMRDRQKERKLRTRRLIQEGAVLEKIFPQVALMSLDELESFLYGIFTGNNTMGRSGNRTSLLCYPKGALTHH